jgi:hypothetical protein
LLIGVKSAMVKKRIVSFQRDRPGGRTSVVSKASKSNSVHTVRAGRDAVSAVKFSQELTAAIDAWAEAHQTVRSEAIRQLVELGLNAPTAAHQNASHPDSVAIEALAIRQLKMLLDPSLPPDERERRIRRLVEGPPEFSNQRIDLPKHQR